MADRSLHRFWLAGGMTGPLRLLVWDRGRPSPAERVLERPFAVVGRSAPADLVLDHPQVSRRHALLQVVGGRLFCLDLGSRSAIAWAGVPRRSGWIEPGRPVEIGPFRVGLATGADADRGPDARPPCDPLGMPPATGRPAARLLLEDAADPGRPARPIDRMLTTVGRAPDCQLRLGDLSVSRIHCVLLRLGETCWIVDLHGRGGVAVNGERRRWAPLAHGDEVQIGRFRLAVRLDAPPPALVDGRARPTPLALPGPTAGLPILPEPAPIELLPPDADPDTRAMLAPLLDQFSAMQQQLFDQYHRSMMEMMSVFLRVHRDQQGLVDRELRKIRRLTREVRSLRRELDRSQEERGGPPMAPGSARPIEQVPDPIGPPIASTPRGSPEDYRAAQARLIARLNDLQQERQGRWQRLLGRLSRGADGPA